MIEQSFMKSLFHGVIAEELIAPWPEPSAEERDQVALMLDSIRKFGATIDSAKIDREHQIPESALRAMKDLGLFGMLIPQEYGGLGLSARAYARITQELAGIDASLAVTLGAHQSIGLKGLLLFGTDAQKRKYLPKLASGENVAAFALTEPSAGSDAAAIQTRAILSDDGEGYVLDGSKIWITNGGFADIFTVFARTSPAEEGNKPKITAFLVERAHGVTSGPNEQKLGIRGSSTTAIHIDGAKVPHGNVLGEVGRGFKVAMEVLNSGRLGLGAGCVGMSKQLIGMAVERCGERKAFGRAIGQFGIIKDKIARMMVETFALESAVYLTSQLVDAKVDYSLESAICKVLGSETLWRVANETLQIAAGTGYMQEYPFERLLRDARINLIFEGTNEILRCFVALSGMQGPGRELAEVGRAMREPIKGFGLLSDFALRKARSALGRERLHRVHPLLNKETVLFEEHTAELARNVEKVLRKHGKEIAEMQYTQKRVADLAIDLFALAACLSRTTHAIERKGEEGARRELELTTAFANQASERMTATVRAFDRNDDELLKGIAGRTYVDGGYPFDPF
ncbi:MAG: acyl-CoA dehydrogenase family protein [Polyangiales bacterium]